MIFLGFNNLQIKKLYIENNKRCFITQYYVEANKLTKIVRGKNTEITFRYTRDIQEGKKKISIINRPIAKRLIQPYEYQINSIVVNKYIPWRESVGGVFYYQL